MGYRYLLPYIKNHWNHSRCICFVWDGLWHCADSCSMPSFRSHRLQDTVLAPIHDLSDGPRRKPSPTFWPLRPTTKETPTSMKSVENRYTQRCPIMLKITSFQISHVCTHGIVLMGYTAPSLMISRLWFRVAICSIYCNNCCCCFCCCRRRCCCCCGCKGSTAKNWHQHYFQTVTTNATNRIPWPLVGSMLFDSSEAWLNCIELSKLPRADWQSSDEKLGRVNHRHLADSWWGATSSREGLKMEPERSEWQDLRIEENTCILYHSCSQATLNVDWW